MSLQKNKSQNGTRKKKIGPAFGTVRVTLTYEDRVENHPEAQQMSILSDQRFLVKDSKENNLEKKNANANSSVSKKVWMDLEKSGGAAVGKAPFVLC